MKRKRTVRKPHGLPPGVFLSLFLMTLLLPRPVSTSVVVEVKLPRGYEMVSLGEVRVTQYTHHETGSRVTSSGYVLRDQDEGRVCAISRDWWRSRVKPGDLVWVGGRAQPCVALDTMALRNRKGLLQSRWVDIYITNRQAGLDFGIQKAPAFLIRRVRS
ncbi:MAG: hypothetical protein HY926_06855 [Elusimicrobia bacterium]|nr:hypothetical protein [Elusimicrobiota bacterium]